MKKFVVNSVLYKKLRECEHNGWKISVEEKFFKKNFLETSKLKGLFPPQLKCPLHSNLPSQYKSYGSIHYLMLKHTP